MGVLFGGFSNNYNAAGPLWEWAVCVLKFCVLGPTFWMVLVTNIMRFELRFGLRFKTHRVVFCVLGH